MIFQAVILGITLAMDAFSICISKALACNEVKLKIGVKMGFTFGIFQAVMPLIGFMIGNSFYNLIKDYFNIVSFIILVFLGGKMIYECINSDDDNNSDISFRELIMLGVATSIDALAAGFIFSGKDVSMVLISCLIIGVITFFICLIGYIFGAKLGRIIGEKGELIGGIVLILLGVKFLIEFFV